MCDCNLDSYESTPHDNYAGKCHYDIDPKRIHKGLKFADDFGEVFVKSCCKQCIHILFILLFVFFFGFLNFSCFLFLNDEESHSTANAQNK